MDKAYRRVPYPLQKKAENHSWESQNRHTDRYNTIKWEDVRMDGCSITVSLLPQYRMNSRFCYLPVFPYSPIYLSSNASITSQMFVTLRGFCLLRIRGHMHTDDRLTPWITLRSIWVMTMFSLTIFDSLRWYPFRENDEEFGISICEHVILSHKFRDDEIS